jgi:hypothetical protein
MELAATTIMNQLKPMSKRARRGETPLFSSTWVALFLTLRRQWAQTRSS